MSPETFVAYASKRGIAFRLDSGRLKAVAEREFTENEKRLLREHRESVRAHLQRAASEKLEAKPLAVAEPAPESAPLILSEFEELIARARRDELAKGMLFTFTVCGEARFCRDFNAYFLMAEECAKRLLAGGASDDSPLLATEREMLRAIANTQAAIQGGELMAKIAEYVKINGRVYPFGVCWNCGKPMPTWEDGDNVTCDAFCEACISAERQEAAFIEAMSSVSDVVINFSMKEKAVNR